MTKYKGFVSYKRKNSPYLKEIWVFSYLTGIYPLILKHNKLTSDYNKAYSKKEHLPN
jgi:hypothetical protein